MSIRTNTSLNRATRDVVSVSKQSNSFFVEGDYNLRTSPLWGMYELRQVVSGVTQI